MIKKSILIVCLSVLPFAIFADDSGLADLIYTAAPVKSSAASIERSNAYQANKYRNDAAKLNKTSTINRTASKSVQNAEKEKISIEKSLRTAYLKLSDAYQSNNSHMISKYEMETWKLKELLKISDEKIDLAYQINEFEKGLRDYPNSEEMKSLVQQAASDANNYIDLANKILTLKRQQVLIKKKLESKQGEAQIIRQKELLKKMEAAHNQKYGD